MNVNKIHFVGRLVHTPEIKILPSGVMIAEISLANNRTWKDKNGEKQEESQFIDAKYFGKVAEVIMSYATKGQEVYVGGRIKTDRYEGKDGTIRYKTYIMGEEFQLGARSKNNPDAPASTGPRPDEGEAYPDDIPQSELPSVEYPTDDINPDDIPF